MDRTFPIRETGPAKAQESDVRGDEFAFLNSKFCGFSCPQEGLDEEFLGLVAVTYAREITRLFLSRYATELTCRGHGLVDLVEDWLNRDITFEMVWDPAVSNTFRAIQTGSAAQAINNGAALALRASASGVPGESAPGPARPMAALPESLQWSQSRLLFPGPNGAPLSRAALHNALRRLNLAGERGGMSRRSRTGIANQHIAS